MSLTSRRSRPLPRDTGLVRDARLFVIATEDTKAPKQYFSFFPSSRVHVEVLETTGGCSSPGHVVERLAKYAEAYQIGEDDQLWVLLDTDHWVEGSHKRGLIAALDTARQRGFRIAMSNPCFDLWLLLHHQAVTAADGIENCDAVGRRLRDPAVLGEFNKTRLKSEHYPYVAVTNAVRNARALEWQMGDAAGGFWPEKPGTRVFRLIEELRQAGVVL